MDDCKGLNLFDIRNVIQFFYKYGSLHSSTLVMCETHHHEKVWRFIQQIGRAHSYIHKKLEQKTCTTYQLLIFNEC